MVFTAILYDNRSHTVLSLLVSNNAYNEFVLSHCSSDGTLNVALYTE